jgi:predicted O-methyltransferase YrrM
MTAAEIARVALDRHAAQKVSELEPFVEMVLELAPRTVVEIGTMAGGTLGAWCAAAADDALVVSIDLPGGPWGGGYTPSDEPYLRSLARNRQTVELIQGDSHSLDVALKLATVLHAHGRDLIDLLFIDGDHSYDGVSQDFETYAPLVRSGGIVAFHDILPHPDVPGCDVDAFWREVSSRYLDTREFTAAEERHPDWGQWGGIGVVVKP